MIPASAAGADRLSLLVLGAGLAAIAWLVMRRWPRLAVVTWLAVVCFVPVWLGATVVVYLMPTVMAGGLILLALLPATSRGVVLGDWGVTCFLAACLAPVLVGEWNANSVFVVLSQWGLAFALGRIMPLRVDPRWIHQCIAVAFTVVSVGALAEFLWSWNPFVGLTAGNRMFATWATLQERGGMTRAEWAFGHSIALGSAVGLAIPFALASRFPFWARGGMTLLMLAATVVTFSRVSMIGAVLAVLLSLAFLSHEVSRRTRWTVAGLLAVAAAVAIPLVSRVFESAGAEATASAGYRGRLLSLVPDISVIGMAPTASWTPAGELRFGNYGSIDSAVLLLGLRYGWLALALGVALLLGAVAMLLVGRATPALVAVVAQIPALATVALITQSAMLFWFVAGLAVYGQTGAARGGAPPRAAAPGELPPSRFSPGRSHV